MPQAQEPGGHGSPHVCSARHAFILSTGLRRLIHKPEKILAGLVREGQTVLDIGCGPGFFTTAMAGMVGDEGLVIAADIQPEMLEMVRASARKVGVESRIRLHESQGDKIGLNEPVDFALAFYMVHEVPDPDAFLREVYGLLKPGGQLLLVEPKFHVGYQAFWKAVEIAEAIGFRQVGTSKIVMSRSVLLQRE